MSKIKNSGLDKHGAEPFEQQQFGTDGVEVVKSNQITTKLPHKNLYEKLNTHRI